VGGVIVRHDEEDIRASGHVRLSLPKFKSSLKAHLTDADWVVVVVTGLSTLTTRIPLE
jgi:hypothetical protein